MQDQLRILTTVISLSVKKHGTGKALTIGHLLNICKLAHKYEEKIVVQEEKDHIELLEQINTYGQD